jgi:hypothetical protein
MLSVEPAYAQRDGGLLPPEESGMVTVAGCFLRAAGGDDDEFVLAHPRRGPVDSVAEETCAADAGANALVLDNAKDHGMDDALVGRWVEISGRLEKETSDDPDNLRELDVESFRTIPVVLPRAEAPVIPETPIAETPQAFAPEPAPVATTGQEPTLPRTASPLPVMAWIGLLSLAGSLALRRFRS